MISCEEIGIDKSFRGVFSEWNMILNAIVK